MKEGGKGDRREGKRNGKMKRKPGKREGGRSNRSRAKKVIKEVKKISNVYVVLYI